MTLQDMNVEALKKNCFVQIVDKILPVILVGQVRSAAAHLLFVHLPYRQSLSILHSCVFEPVWSLLDLFCKGLVKFLHRAFESPTMPEFLEINDEYQEQYFIEFKEGACNAMQCSDTIHKISLYLIGLVNSYHMCSLFYNSKISSALCSQVLQCSQRS